MNKLEKVKALLPDIVLDIAELVGFPATEKLVKKMGGLQIRVAKKIHKMDELRARLLLESLGRPNAEKFAHYFGGSIIYIPKCDNALRELRNQSFLRDIENLKFCGYSTSKAFAELCPRYGISDRFGWELINKQNKHFQHDLFNQ